MALDCVKGMEFGRVQTSSCDCAVKSVEEAESPRSDDRKRESPKAFSAPVFRSSAWNLDSAWRRISALFPPNKDRTQESSKASTDLPTRALSGAAIREIRSVRPTTRAWSISVDELSFLGILGCWPERMPEPALNHLISRVPLRVQVEEWVLRIEKRHGESSRLNWGQLYSR